MDILRETPDVTLIWLPMDAERNSEGSRLNAARLSVALETESTIFETASWLKRQNRKRET